MNFLTRLQDDIEGILLSDPALVKVPVLVERKGVTGNDIAQEIGAFNTRLNTAEIGAAIVVVRPDVGTPAAGSTMLQFDTTLTVKVFELPVVNLADGGIGLTAEDIALQIIKVVHLWSMAQSRAITLASTVIAPTDAPDGHVGYDVFLKWSDGLEKPERTPRPTITYDAGAEEVTLNCSDEEATIYYTTDGSFPYPDNPVVETYNEPVTHNGVVVTHEDGVVTYGDPFTASSSTEIRAIAIRTGYLPSNLKSITLSALA